MQLKTCEFACPLSAYPEFTVRPDAATDVQNPKFPEEAWESGVIVRGELVQAHVPAGCLLKVFNDGLQLPVERATGSIDITCVGPENPACPAVQGYHLETTNSSTIFGDVTAFVTRR